MLAKLKKDYLFIIVFALIFMITYGLKLFFANAAAYQGYGAVYLLMSPLFLLVIAGIALLSLVLTGIGVAITIHSGKWRYGIIAFSTFLSGLLLPNLLEYAEEWHFNRNKEAFECEIRELNNSVERVHGYTPCKYLVNTKRIVFNLKTHRIDFYRYTPNRRIIWTQDSTLIRDSDLISKRRLTANWYFAEFDFN